VAAAAAEAVEVAVEVAAGAVVEAAADAADAGAAAAAVAACPGAVAASVRLERLPISARYDDHDGRASPGHSCFIRDTADMMHASSQGAVSSSYPFEASA
jgi:hypothetical protein